MHPALNELIGALPLGVVTADPDLLDKYRRDRANDPNAGHPIAAVRAESTAHVQEVVRWCARHRVPLVPRGAGTGLSGGSTAVEGCVVVSTERMRAVSIDPALRVAVVQPGALNAEVKRAAGECGLWYPPDPSSFEICSIGGNIATNAGGLCCVKYGVTGDYVLALEVVLADGAAVRLGGPFIKDVAGLPVMKMFIGSEGTLGVITEAILRLVPRQGSTSTLVATFHSVEAAADAVLAITSVLRPSMLEFMDGVTINAVEDMLGMGLDRSAAGLLVAQSDSPGVAAHEIAVMAQACRAHAADEVFVTDDPDDGEAFVVARRSAIPAVERTGSLLLEDVGVPIPLLPDLLAGIRSISDEHAVTIATIAHAGDGNTHPLIVYDPADSAMVARASDAFGAVMDLAIGLGGTITGEHGVGRLKKDWLPRQLGPDAMELTRRLKTAFDPDNILNPGSIL